MEIVLINEPIRVLAAFSGGGLEPLRFDWNGRGYEIEAVNGRWTDSTTAGRALHFSVQIGDETYYIHFAGGEIQWWLDQIVMEG